MFAMLLWLCRLTSQITDPAPVMSDLKQRRHRGVLCICFVKRGWPHFFVGAAGWGLGLCFMMNTGAMLLTPCWMRCGRAFLDGNGGRYAPKSSAMSAINVRTPQCVFLVFMFGISNAVRQCLTPELSEAGGPARPNRQLTWPARFRSRFC